MPVQPVRTHRPRKPCGLGSVMIRGQSTTPTPFSFAIIVLTLVQIWTSMRSTSGCFVASFSEKRTAAFFTKSPTRIAEQTRETTALGIFKSPLKPASSVNNQAVLDVLLLARKMGPVGSYQSEEDQKRLLDMARSLPKPSNKAARIPLEGIHSLVYSAAPGGSSGKLFGPVYGKVQQEFVDQEIFINSVQLGPLKIALQAKRKIMNDTSIKVTFLKSSVSVFGNNVVEKELAETSGGVWKYLFCDTITDVDGTKKLLRIMETPSLFVIEQPLSDS